ncbi:ABC transporter ATP-binding protein [Leptolyngbya sp. FACHB-261]|uniref:ABC transporter ATP-binding protein n=1 Tax=Leptolyngbya sp. FACHB-261 TaxID=2692806 RepID=UPI0016821F41|nr:ABC transporter ATP-binding protein [Leptolyngbya sp. FACHB-261]MBD2103585.1 ABC transporter ATP-binding protein [Leptolyngbya sp. FACHB-261]
MELQPPETSLPGPETSAPETSTPEAPPEEATDPGLEGPVIDIEGLWLIYGSGSQQTVALRDVSLQVEQGEFISLVGPSGCGKTTLLRVLADLIEPTSGSVRILRGTPLEARLERQYGYVFQSPVLYEWRTVLKNVMLPLEVMGFPATERKSRAQAMLKLVGLSEFETRYPWQLSGGMQQRVSIARALSFDPDLLYMDEPFGALDEITRERLNLELLRLWSTTGKTVVFVTHSISEAVFLSTRVVVMTPRPGKIEQIVNIDLPQPRTMDTTETPEFFGYVTQIKEILRAAHSYEAD